MAAGALKLSGDSVGTAVKLVSVACGNPLGEPVDGAARTEAVTTSGDACVGLAAVSTYLATSSGQATKLLGSTPELRAQVSEWLTRAATDLAGLMDVQLQKVNRHLASRTYLVGSSLTLADLVVLGVLYPALTSLPVAQVDQLCNLLRWADLVQHTAGSEVLAPLAFAKPRFVPPPPPPPPAAAPSNNAAAQAAKQAAVPAAAAAAPSGKAAPAAEAPSTSAPAPAAAATADGGAAAAPAPAPAGGKKEKKAAAAAAGAAKAGSGGGKGGGSADDLEPSIAMLDLCVGTIVKVQRHPNADALYLEEIDVGEDKPRQVISGLVKFVPQERMEGRRVVVVLNLKPAKMRDVMSYGMVLCASNDAHDQVDPIIPPEGVPNGERITFEGFANAPLAEVNPKKKILERLFPDLTTDASGTPQYKGVPFNTSKGVVTSTIPNAHVA